MNSNKIKFQLGRPKAGWLPVKLQDKDYHLEFIVSNVPNDPIDELMSSIILICDGIAKPSQSCWHLEPHCFYFQLEKKEKFELTISESFDYLGPQQFVRKIDGTFGEIVMPLYRALRNFQTNENYKRYWTQIDDERSLKMKKLVKEKQKHLTKPKPH